MTYPAVGRQLGAQLDRWRDCGKLDGRKELQQTLGKKLDSDEHPTRTACELYSTTVHYGIMPKT